jgi:endonuclease G
MPHHQHKPILTKGTRLNIIQHPQGGPKRLAIRSNFFMNSASRPNVPHRLNYLTDTEPGSSGSPVLNDDWQVVALHSASIKVPETQYKGDVIKYNNQGIAIQAVIESLQDTVREEIETIQAM